MVGMRREGTKQGGWERAGRDWVKRPCPNTATSKVPIFEDSLLDVACQGPPCVAFLDVDDDPGEFGLPWPKAIVPLSFVSYVARYGSRLL